LNCLFSFVKNNFNWRRNTIWREWWWTTSTSNPNNTISI
jgi:hypothetical protein